LYDLHFHSGARGYALWSVSTYSRIVKSRVLATFDDDSIEEEACSASEAFFEKKSNEPAWDDSGPDESEIADDADELGQYIYEDLRFVGDQVTMLAIAGVYHLWERRVKEFLESQFGDYCTPYMPLEKVRTADFKKITKVLSAFGWDIRETDFYSQLDRLRLVANVAKHGDGTSSEELFKKAPDMFKTTGLNAPPAARMLKLSQDDFCRAVDAVTKFFTQFPKHLHTETRPEKRLVG
jgi:hypothetical protein